MLLGYSDNRFSAGVRSERPARVPLLAPYLGESRQPAG